jgi:FMN phosphatase YigB (HAD superfamily)
VYHIGDNYEKDHIGAKAARMHPIILDRFNSKKADVWRENGAHVLHDLAEVRQWLELRKCFLRPSRWWEATNSHGNRTLIV